MLGPIPCNASKPTTSHGLAFAISRRLRLSPVFGLLRSLRAPVAHYKVCSTFDSAPHVGSIGRAVDLAAPVFGPAWVPLVEVGEMTDLVDGLAEFLHEHGILETII